MYDSNCYVAAVAYRASEEVVLGNGPVSVYINTGISSEASIQRLLIVVFAPV